MRKYKLLIILLTVILLTGCTTNKLEKFLTKENYKCEDGVCYVKEEFENIHTLEKTYDINKTIYIEQENFYIAGSQGYNLEYNWSNSVIKGKYFLPAASFDVFLNVNDDRSFECNSDDQDELYVKAECISLKEQLKNLASRVDEVIKNNK